MSSYKSSVKPSTPVLQSIRILDQLRERIRYMHYTKKLAKLLHTRRQLSYNS